MKRWLLLGSVLLLLGAGAPMSGEAVRARFFGADLAGILQPAGAPWRECIEASGRTMFFFDGAAREGKAWVRDSDGALCFAYADDDFSEIGCFRAYQDGPDQFRFIDAAGGEGGVWVAERATRVRACPSKDAPVG